MNRTWAAFAVGFISACLAMALGVLLGGNR